MNPLHKLREHAVERPFRPAFRVHRDDRWVDVLWAEHFADVGAIAQAFDQLGTSGVQAVQGTPRQRLAAELALICLGAQLAPEPGGPTVTSLLERGRAAFDGPWFDARIAASTATLEVEGVADVPVRSSDRILCAVDPVHPRGRQMALVLPLASGCPVYLGGDIADLPQLSPTVCLATAEDWAALYEREAGKREGWVARLLWPRRKRMGLGWCRRLLSTAPLPAEVRDWYTALGIEQTD